MRIVSPVALREAEDVGRTCRPARRVRVDGDAQRLEKIDGSGGREIQPSVPTSLRSGGRSTARARSGAHEPTDALEAERRRAGRDAGEAAGLEQVPPAEQQPAVGSLMACLS